MQYQPQGESIWGVISACEEIVPGIYAVCATDQNGLEHEGIMADRNASVGYLSAEAAGLGEEAGEWLCYDEHTKDIPLYEILQHRLDDCKKREAAIVKQMEEIRQDGRLMLTEYFGEYTPPKEAPGGCVEAVFPVANGVHLIRDRDGLAFAVHEAVADNFMTMMASGYGVCRGEYLFYAVADASCAVALNELKNVFEEAAALIVSENSLYATLNRYFAGYTALYNLCVPEMERIPAADGPANLYLAIQVEAMRLSREEKQE